MLHERWLKTLDECHDQVALRDLASDRAWTFAELDREALSGCVPSSQVLFPTGRNTEFIIETLHGWKHGRTICPLEEGQAPPPLGELPGECRLIKTTSATTGAPRCVLFNASQVAADVDQIVTTMGLRRDWPNLGVISLAHSYGFSNLVLPLLLRGIPLTLGPLVLPEAVRLAAQSGEAWTLAGVPALWRAWHEAGAIPGSVKLAISAGAPLPLSLEQAVIEATGLKIHNFLGSSECGGIAFDRSRELRSDASLVGGAMDGVGLERDADGCLVVRSRAVGMGYWPEADERLSEGCFRTCDLVDIRDGEVFLQGRASDLINVAGRKVSPESIERVLLQFDSVADCLVLGLPSTETGHGEIIGAVVVLRKPCEETQLRQHLLVHLPAWQVPRQWHFVDSLGVNQRGKLSRTEWRRKLVDS